MQRSSRSSVGPPCVRAQMGTPRGRRGASGARCPTEGIVQLRTGVGFTCPLSSRADAAGSRPLTRPRSDRGKHSQTSMPVHLGKVTAASRHRVQLVNRSIPAHSARVRAASPPFRRTLATAHLLGVEARAAAPNAITAAM